LHQELAAKQKPPDHQVGGLPLLRRRFFVQRVISPHIGGNFGSRSRHRGSPLLGCQTHFGVIPDVGENRSRIALSLQLLLLPSAHAARNARVRGTVRSAKLSRARMRLNYLRAMVTAGRYSLEGCADTL